LQPDQLGAGQPFCSIGDDRRGRVRGTVVHQHELDAGCGVPYQAPEIFGGLSLNVEERDDDRQPDHLFDHKESAATLEDQQGSGSATLSELQMITRRVAQCLPDVQLATPA